MKTTYLSLNLQGELAVLLQSGSFEEIGLYLILKKLADFKTGMVGTFKKQKLTCRQLAEAMTRPASQGKKEIVFEDKEIWRLLERLQGRGLIVEINNQDGLRLRLPLSPIHTPPAGVVNASPLGNPARLSKSQGQKQAQSHSENPSVSKPLSVLVNTSQYHQYLSSTDQTRSEDAVMDDLFAGKISIREIEPAWLAGCGATTAPSGHYQSQGDASPSRSTASFHPDFLNASSAHPVESPEAFEGLTDAALGRLQPLEAYEAIIREAGLLHASGDLSKEIYQQWRQAGVCWNRLRQALELLKAYPVSDHTPMVVHKILFPHAPATGQSQTRKGTGRGKVAL